MKLFIFAVLFLASLKNEIKAQPVEESLTRKWISLTCSTLGLFDEPRPVIAGTNRFYTIHNMTLSWVDAQNFCLQNNKSIATFESYSDLSALITYLGANGTDIFWIGLTDAFQEGIFQWVKISTSDVFPTNYQIMNNNDANDCATITGGTIGEISMKPCTELHYVICEIPPYCHVA